ncbi:MAG: hypothetical protein HY709_04740 [Candidatus Latescibacteria bacterium]|nr:hypothetical protein [Candidatus Latescibacterota bacterium]
MAHAYTPGLRVAERTVIRKRRILPIPGDLLVHQGDSVRAETIVACTNLPGKVQTVNVVNILGITPAEIHGFMTKREGDSVRRGETLAENHPFIRWFKTTVPSPVDGTVESISTVTGQVLLREPPRSLDLSAYVDGRVVEVVENEGVVVETVATFIQGIFGLGGETTGPLAVVVDAPDEVLTSDRLREDHRGKIVVGGSFAGSDTFRMAKDIGVKGLIVGGSNDQDLRDLLGYDLGVAITGTEQIGFTLIVSEGFGGIPMADRTFRLLKMMEGRRTSISGATQIRAGVIRPEVIIPETGAVSGSYDETVQPVAERGAMQEGDIVRVIRPPHFGRIGTVTSLPPDLVQIPTESYARILEVKFQDGEVAVVPRANVEIMEE